MAPNNLEEVLEASDGLVELFRSREARANTDLENFGDIAPEYTNWRDEQLAWKESVALSDQSHHMDDLFVEGPDALDLFADLGINNFDDFEPGQAKQFVACNPDGYYIGDGILFHLEENKFDLVGGSPVNWVLYHLDEGDYEASAELEPSARNRDYPPRNYRYQIQGPYALDVMEEAIDGELPEIPFFDFDELSIDGREVYALRHGMVNTPGFEFWGPWDDADYIKDTIMDVGEQYDIRHVGTTTYLTNALLTGWIAGGTPAIYSEGMEDYRQWLAPDGRAANRGLAGSFKSDNIEDYYLTMNDLGYSQLVDFDHDFIGKEALRDQVENPERQKVTLVWDHDDFTDVYHGSLFRDEDPFKFMDLPRPHYGTPMYDAVLKDGETVGVSMWPAYLYTVREMLSLGCVDIEHADPGTEVTVVWGEEDSPKSTVEDHVETEIKATVESVPFQEDQRKTAPHTST